MFPPEFRGGSRRSGDDLRSIFASLLDHLYEGCSIVGRDWRYLAGNAAAAARVGLTPQDLPGRLMPDVAEDAPDHELKLTLEQCMAQRNRGVSEVATTRPDGGRAWYEFRIEPVPEGLFIMTLDITKRKTAEARSAHLREVLRGIRHLNELITNETDARVLVRKVCALLVEGRGYEGVVVGLLDPDREGVAVQFRDGVDLPLTATQDPGASLPDCVRQAVASGGIVVRSGGDPACRGCPAAVPPRPFGDEWIVALAHGDRLLGFLVAALPPGDEGDPEERSLLMEIADDLAFALAGLQIRAERDRSAADLTAVEEQFRQAQKLEAVARLAGGVAHDFNNILAAQLGYCDLVLEGIDPDGSAAADIKVIRDCAVRAADLTHQLLAFSRRQPMRIGIVDLNAVVQDIDRMLGRLIGEDVRRRLVLAPDLGHVAVDRGQMEQVIMNLAVNARDAMPGGGDLIIETANVLLDAEYARLHSGARSGPHVMLAVTDTGTGMDEATVRRLFEPFFTTKERGKGTGLGLATVYGIVKQTGGNIWVYSEPGRGTIFKVYLPRADQELTPPPRQEAVAAGGRGELILVVEDDAAVRELMARMLASLGYRARIAADPAEALAVVRDEGLAPAVLVTDVVMPGMSGTSLATRLVALMPGLKVVYMSGYTEEAIANRESLDEEMPFLQKPFGTAALGIALREALDSP